MSFLRSVKFFYLIVALYAIQASWIALSGVYPMAFDENYHLRIIRLYSHHLSPFWAQQPAGNTAFGAVTRDPSYMYHYLSSFIYRFISIFFHSETMQVIILRFISILMFGLGIVIFRKVLLNTKAPKALVNFVLAVFILTPVVPFLAAQINYDNLVFPLVATALLLTQKFLSELDDAKHLDIKNMFLLLVVCILGSIVKYAFLPVFLGLFMVIVYKIVGYCRANSRSKAKFQLTTAFKNISRIQLVILSCVIVMLGGLFVERYGINSLKYGTPTPECNQVLSIEKCQDNGSWLRNYQAHQDKLNGKLPPVSADPINYTAHTWLKRISNDMFYALNGSSSSFKTGQPFVLVRILSIMAMFVGACLFIWWRGDLRRKYQLNLLIAVMLVYVGTLWSQNYVDFVHIGLAVAIQGRYLVPVLPIIYLIMGLGVNILLDKRTIAKFSLSVAAGFVLVTQGGGIGVYILRSDASWYWPSPVVNRVNNATRKILHSVVIGS